MADVVVISDNIYSPIGATTAENMAALEQGRSAVQRHDDSSRASQPFFASLFSAVQMKKLAEENGSTSFENLVCNSITEALNGTSVDVKSKDVVLLLSSTKGNISLLEENVISKAIQDAISLPLTAQRIASKLGHPNQPLVISNACISGHTALIVARRLLLSGKYKHAVVAGADLITRFVLSGFESFQAISAGPCKPFDADRTGINLGEAASTIVLSRVEQAKVGDITLSGGAISNDANHISGPSRTGEELAWAIARALKEANLEAEDIDFISAHGTATLFNDEMESKAFGIAGLAAKPVNSLKGFYGHTLGAAGLLESVVTIQSMKKSLIFPTFGWNTPGVPVPLQLSNRLVSACLDNCLKTGSGFGGCNAAIVFSKKNAA